MGFEAENLEVVTMFEDDSVSNNVFPKLRKLLLPKQIFLVLLKPLQFAVFFFANFVISQAYLGSKYKSRLLFYGFVTPLFWEQLHVIRAKL